ncbi:PHD finger protein 24 [Frankliniella fusca]|uniref:PHD finger protein 24 n=1 Tax=Frankliniella fusca TaxID=407009 RepID=A0AAE1HMV8_9NEOP|nr:PHD finger protein 24 [Frankliniella fusca]
MVILRAKAFKKFNPTSVTSFNKHKWYAVKSKTITKSEKEEYFWALIGKLAANKSDLSPENIGRVSFPPVALPDFEPDSTHSEDGRLRVQAGKSVVQEAKAARKANEKRRRDAQNRDLEEYYRNTALPDEALNESDEPELCADRLPLQNKASKKVVRNKRSSEDIEIDEFMRNTSLPDADLDELAPDEQLIRPSKKQRGNSIQSASFSSDTSESTNSTSLETSIKSMLGILKGVQSQMLELTKQMAEMKKENETVKGVVGDINVKLSKSQSKVSYIQSWLNDLPV